MNITLWGAYADKQAHARVAELRLRELKTRRDVERKLEERAATPAPERWLWNACSIGLAGVDGEGVNGSAARALAAAHAAAGVPQNGSRNAARKHSDTATKLYRV